MLDGYKTYIGGAGFILTGVGGILTDWYEGSSFNVNWLYTIWGGIAIIGGYSKYKRTNG